MNPSRSVSRLLGLLLMATPWALQPLSIAQAEDLQIEFSRAAIDPLVELFLPPTGSPDRIRFVPEGMLIEQRADVPGKPTGVSGFKTSLLAGGDFTVTFDFKCLRLDETTEGWGQGLALAVFLDDEKQSKLVMALLACPKQGQLCQVEINTRPGEKEPIYRPHHNMPFKEGSFIIARSGKEVTFTVDNGKERRLLETFPCSTADLSGVELGCTRLEKGNTPAEYLLKRLTINSNRIFSYQTPKKPWFTWWKALVAAQVVLVVGLLIVVVRRRNQ